MSSIIRYCKTQEDHVGDNCFDVSRPHILSNPYTFNKENKQKDLIKVRTKDEALRMYKAYFKEMMNSKDRSAKPFQNEFNKIVEAYRKYDTIYIGCYCHLDEECHGDFIIEQVIKKVVQEDIIKKAKEMGTDA